MRISELSTEELAPVLVDLTTPVSNIAMDEDTIKQLRDVGSRKTVLEQTGSFIRGIMPLLLKTHFEDTCAIIAILTGKKTEEVKKQKGLMTIADAIGVVDSDLMDFFKSFVHTEQKK